MSPGRKELTLKERVLRFIREKQLVTGGQKLLVAVSGGPDSVCLLHILASLQNELDIKLHVAHLDHQLRGAESEADARFVADLSRRLRLPASIESRDVKDYQARHHASLEEAAREVRYTFLAHIAGSIGSPGVVVGHTVDDHVETILMHLIRGSGTRGLEGLRPLSRWPYPGVSLDIIRPLLELTRAETSAYCRRHRLAPRLDASNLSLSPMRNRIRQQLLPQLQAYNPRINEALLRTARLAADDLAFIEAAAARLLSELTRKEGNTVILDKQGLAALPVALQRHLLRNSMETLLGSLKDIEARHIEALVNALDKPAGKTITLPGGLTFTVEYDKYLLGSDAAALSPFPSLGEEARLNVPGTTSTPGWNIEASVTKPGGMEEWGENADGFTTRLDYDKAGGNLTVRGRRPGDRFQPLGMGQPKKLNQFMIDARIPQAWRRRIPIVCSAGQILWVVGWRIDERVKVTDRTRQVLWLKFKRC